MTDSEPLYEDPDESPSPADDRLGTNRRSLMTVVAIIVVIVVAALLLLMLRGCGSVLNGANRSSSGNQIVPVEGGRPVDGAISVWVAPGIDVNEALTAASVRTSGIVDMGDGRFVVSVPTGTEVEAVRLLRDARGVHDAGRVYAEGTTAP